MDLIKSIFEAGLVIWNTIVGTSIQFFTADPLSFSKTSGQVAIIKDAAGAISTIALPVVAVFFLLALVKELVSTPIEMVPRKLALNLIKYIVICALVANSYELMCTISNISAGIVRMVNASLMDMGYTEEELHLGSVFGLLTTDSTSLVHRKISMQGKAITECISMMLGMTGQDPGKVFAPFILESSKVYIDKVTAKRGLR